jgi:DNA-binding NarL/FixJ family response regulator
MDFPLSIFPWESENKSRRKTFMIPFVTVLISDADEYFRQQLHQALSGVPGLHVMGDTDSIQDTIQLARLIQPDTILLNPALLNGAGVEAAEAGLFATSKVLLVSEANAEAHTLPLLQLGAQGCLIKDENLWEKLPAALRAVYRGEAVLSPRLTGWVFDMLQQC